MTVLEIRDGQPWWLSPDVWIVPGDDPEGPPGQPVAGAPAYLWARVHNDGEYEVRDAVVRFYWANPAVGFDRTTANLVGSAFVSLPPKQNSAVLCLAPWSVTAINDGHVCVLAEAFHPTLDPLPASPAFNVTSDPHVAQRNLNIVQAADVAPVFVSFEIHNPDRVTRSFTLTAEVADPASLRRLGQTTGIDSQHLDHGGRVEVFGFAHAACLGPDELTHVPDKVEVKLAAGQRAGLFLAARQQEGTTGLVNVVQSAGGREVGGLSCLLKGRV